MTEKLTTEAVLDALGKVQEPELHKDLVSLKMIKDLKIDEGVVEFTIVLTTPACPMRTQIQQEAKQAILSIPGVKSVNVKLDAQVPRDNRLHNSLELPIKNAIAVASGKGGVGKSTISVNLAVALARLGACVGIMDADVYGPNIPTMMKVSTPPGTDGKKLIPPESHGVKLMSMGFLVKPGQPLIWRGPMLHSAIQQFLSDVIWGELDYLIIDLPPGTGDASLSLAQTLPLTGVIIVTLPQSVSLEDASRGLEMFRTLEVPILGVVENMSGSIFGSGGGENLSKIAKVPFFGSVPMETVVRISGDVGEPVVIAHPDSEAAKILWGIAEKVAAQVSLLSLRKEKAAENKSSEQASKKPATKQPHPNK